MNIAKIKAAREANPGIGINGLTVEIAERLNVDIPTAVIVQREVEVIVWDLSGATQREINAAIDEAGSQVAA